MQHELHETDDRDVKPDNMIQRSARGAAETVSRLIPGQGLIASLLRLHDDEPEPLAPAAGAYGARQIDKSDAPDRSNRPGDGSPGRILTPAVRLDAVVDSYRAPPAQAAIVRIIKIHGIEERRCTCSTTDTCPLGRVEHQDRCRESELRTAGVPVESAEHREHFPRSPRGLEDAGAAGRPEPPCCKRAGARWCGLEIGHEGGCEAVEQMAGAVAKAARTFLCQSAVKGGS